MKQYLCFFAICVMILGLTNCRTPSPGAKKKPIIYLYPETEMEISVKIEVSGALTHTYPLYDPTKGWKVLAKPDGTLFDVATGKEYYALFWEGTGDEYAPLETGFVVKGAETATFLEEKLEILGLNRREANEFIVYWLPELENNPYNFIHFAEEMYTDNARLEIQPKPETLIRVFMLFQPLSVEKEIKEQVLRPASRKGFTVVEWGGTMLGSKTIN